MSKFNTRETPYDAKTHEGGDGITKTHDAEWLGYLFSSFVEPGFYSSASNRIERFVDLTNDVVDRHGAAFVAKAANFARNELGMRSTSHLIAAIVNEFQFDGKREFYKDFYHRADDVSEVFAAIEALDGKRSHALVNGTRDYVETLDEYQIGKYGLDGKKYNWFDIVNITHANSEVIDKLKRDGKVASPDTWEVAISSSTAQTKEEEWRRLVIGNRLGYLALLRNLRNICDCEFCDDDFIRQYIVPQITNEEAIRKSLVFPYQIYSAVRALSSKSVGESWWLNYEPAIQLGMMNTRLLLALSDAFKMSVSNIPDLSGDSVAIVIDVSGSMQTPISQRSQMSILEVSAVYATALAMKCKNATIVKFGDKAKKFCLDKNANVFEMINQLCDNSNCGYSTRIASCVPLLSDEGYDRLFLFSDMQVLDGHKASQEVISKARYVYSFDLGYYKSGIVNFKSDNVFLLSSLTDTLFKMIPILERGTDGIIEYIDRNY